MLFTGYTKSKIKPYFGAVVGRVANRIKKSQFAIDGRNIKVSANAAGENHLHGGFKGFDKVEIDSLFLHSCYNCTLFRESGRQASMAQSWLSRISAKMARRDTLDVSWSTQLIPWAMEMQFCLSWPLPAPNPRLSIWPTTHISTLLDT